MSDARIEKLHAAYCEATGFALLLRADRMRVWFDFEKAAFTEEDLRLVIRWIRREIPKRNGYTEGSLRFSTLLQLDTFEEKLQLARQAFGRKARPPQVVEQQVGDVRRLVETAPSDKTARAGDVGANVLRDWRLRQASGKSGG